MATKNRFVGGGLALCLALAFLGGIAGAGDVFYSIVGVGIFVFGSIGAYKLLNTKEEA